MAGTLPCIWRRWQKACHCLSLISKNFCCSCLLGGGKGTLKGVKVSEFMTFRRFSVSFTISGLGHEVLEVLLAPGFCTPKRPWPARIPWAPRSKGTMKRFQCHGVNLRKPRERERMAWFIKTWKTRSSRRKGTAVFFRQKSYYKNNEAHLHPLCCLIYVLDCCASKGL